MLFSRPRTQPQAASPSRHLRAVLAPSSRPRFQVSVNSYVRSSGAVGGALSGAAAAALQKQVATLKAELAALRKEAGGGGGGMGGTYGHGGDGSAAGGGHGQGQGQGHAAGVLAERLARLEVDKARLLDRLEVGRHAGNAVCLVLGAWCPLAGLGEGGKGAKGAKGGQGGPRGGREPTTGNRGAGTSRGRAAVRL